MPLIPEKQKKHSHPLLEIKHLSVDFLTQRETIHAVKDVSFNIAQGQTLALVGESGSGKSVTAHSILQLLPQSSRHRIQGDIKFNGQSLLSFDESQMRDMRGEEISMIFQEPMNSLNPLHTVGKQINETLIYHRGYSVREASKQSLELLDLVGIKAPQDRIKCYPHELSGGQCQRVMIAMALANEPKLLIADEPTTALDVTIQAQILTLLKELQSRLNMAMLLITHDLNIVEHVSNHVCVMEKGCIVEQGMTKEIFEAPQHPYTQLLLGSTPTGDPEPRTTYDNDIMSADKLKVWFPLKSGFLQRTSGHIKAVDEVSFNLQTGETLGVVGESGSGKTTLGLSLLRLQASEGEIYFRDTALHNLKERDIRPFRREIQIVFQNPFSSLSPRQSVEEIIEEGLLVHKIGDSAKIREQLVIDALEHVGLDADTRHRYPHEFSGGQRQRIAIARALILKPKLIILDEPTSALDHIVQKQIIDLLLNLQKEYQLTYLFISHDLAVVKALCHHILVMKQGKIVEMGDSNTIFNAPSHPYTKTLMSAAFQ